MYNGKHKAKLPNKLEQYSTTDMTERIDIVIYS